MLDPCLRGRGAGLAPDLSVCAVRVGCVCGVGQIINHYLDQNTKDVIYDDSLSFGDHVGHVDSFYTGDRGTA